MSTDAHQLAAQQLATRQRLTAAAEKRAAQERLAAAARRKDLIYIENQAMIAGFDRCYCSDSPFRFTLFVDTGLVFVHNEYKHEEWRFQHHNNEEHTLTVEIIAEQGWTTEQILVLDWAFNLATVLPQYWNGETPFETIIEFIDFEKANSARIFPASLTKRAVSAQAHPSSADDASQQQ